MRRPQPPGSPPLHLQSLHDFVYMQRLIRRCEGIACRILIQHERLEQVNTFPYLGSLITEEQTDFNLDKTNERALVWPVATYGCESWTPTKNEESRLEKTEKDSAGFVFSKENKWAFLRSWSKEGTVRHCQSNHGETRELLRERDNAKNDVKCTQARKTTHGLGGQHQDVDRTPRGRVSQNDRRQR